MKILFLQLSTSTVSSAITDVELEEVEDARAIGDLERRKLHTVIVAFVIVVCFAIVICV